MCPLCNTSVETTRHVTKCKEAGAAEFRDDAHDALMVTLNKGKTHPDIVTLILMAVTAPKIEERDQLDTINSDVEEINYQQGEIGWDKVELGILSTAFRRVQQRYLEQRGVSRKEASQRTEKWVGQIQHALWDFVWRCWEYRNKRVFGRGKLDQAAKRRLRSQMRRWSY